MGTNCARRSGRLHTGEWCGTSALAFACCRRLPHHFVVLVAAGLGSSLACLFAPYYQTSLPRSYVFVDNYVRVCTSTYAASVSVRVLLLLYLLILSTRHSVGLSLLVYVSALLACYVRKVR